MKANERDTSYEWKAVTLLALGFGLVGARPLAHRAALPVNHEGP